MHFREYFCSFSSKSYYFYILGVSQLNVWCALQKWFQYTVTLFFYRTLNIVLNRKGRNYYAIFDIYNFGYALEYPEFTPKSCGKIRWAA